MNRLRPNCPLLAHGGHSLLHRKCPLSRVMRTYLFALHMSAFDPKRTSQRITIEGAKAGYWHSLDQAALRLLRGHWHQIAVEIGDDPDRAGDDEKDDQHAKGESQNIVCAVRPAAQMQKEDEMDADLRQSEHDQADRDPRGPQQIGLRHDEGSDRRNDS